MKNGEMTLKERAAHVHRRLVLLQRVFQPSQETTDLECLGAASKADDPALSAGIRELLDELIDHVKALSTIPFPLSEWRPGDGSNDERWRALTEIERREVLALVSGYESLISWGETVMRSEASVVHAGGWSGSRPVVLMPGASSREMGSLTDELKAARARVDRFRNEMHFLERRQIRPDAKD